VHDYAQSGQLHFLFDLQEDHFSPSQRKRAITHFSNILHAFLKDPDQLIETVDILEKEEKEQILRDFNSKNSAPLPDQTLVTTILGQAKKTPDAVALSQGDHHLTFTELADQSKKIAHYLITQGLSPEEPVLIRMKRSSEMIIAMLGILRARGAYVPVDINDPQSRVDQIKTDCGARFEFSASSLKLSEIISTESEEKPLPQVQLNDLAYIIYTSGSTGTPKGVMIQHDGLADYVNWAERSYIRGDVMTYAFCTSLSFDLTITSLYLPLITGGCLRVYPEPDGPVDSAILDVVSDNHAEFIKLTPSHLSILKQCKTTDSKLRRMVVGGEDFQTHLARTIQEQLGEQLEIYNEYGPTEAVVGCMIHRFDPQKDTDSSVPIGKPSDGVSLYILNSSLQPVPEGTPGELFIARNGLARGYCQRDKLSAERFIPNPFNPSEKLYRTGDKVRFSQSGVLDYLGRLDRQIKISGHRIEIGEIESSLSNIPGITQSIVTLHSQSAEETSTTGESVNCSKCGISSEYPGASFDDAQVCNICLAHDRIREEAQAYFRPYPELRTELDNAAKRKSGDYDCIVLLSGGKDSTYTLCKIVELGYKVYTYTLDNGYLSTEAKANIARVVESLGVDHEFGSTPAMNDIFRDSLVRFSNVCNGCFKTVYTLATQRAKELGIPAIITGLSRGQFFETRLTENLFGKGKFSPSDVDNAVIEARKVYHAFDDEVLRSLDTSVFDDEHIFEQIQYIDFFRFSDVKLDDMLSYLNDKVPWIRPSDTGRSTNCLINDVGIYIHNKERGYHNYALPYSWDVRMGIKNREEAMEELDDHLDMTSVRKILHEINYDEERLSKASHKHLIAYYLSDSDVNPTFLREELSKTLPESSLPTSFIPITSVPLTTNGKIDYAALPSPDSVQRDAVIHTPPEGPVEEEIANIWAEFLQITTPGRNDHFFRLGGTSLIAMNTMLKISQQFELSLPLQTLFQHPTIQELAQVVEDTILREIDSLSDEDAELLSNNY